MERIFLILLLNVMITTSNRYGDYSGGGVNYGIEPSEVIERIPDAEATYDYKEDEENGGRKGLVENIDIALKKNRKKHFNDDTDYVYMDNREEVTERKLMTELKKRRANRRNKYYSNDSEDRHIKTFREQNIDDRIAFKEDSREDEQMEDFETETENFNRRKNNNRKARRKPRDRPINYKRRDSDRVKPSRDSDEENDKEIKEALGDVTAFKDPPLKGFREYEFYDMKRINNIKDKLPDIIPTKDGLLESSRDKPTTIWPYRRVFAPEKNQTFQTSSTFIPKISTTGTIANTTIIDKKSTNMSDLSLAERSRLSILRKIKKKESLNKTLSTKPPVLMQVTGQMQTVVLVEGHNENDERPSVKEVIDNSPQRIARAKQLMLHKLTADAKNIQELTDNWDEMICDYIDVSLLDTVNRVSRNSVVCSGSIIILNVCTIFMWL